MFCATGGICLVNQSEQAAGSFVIGWGAGRGLPAERTYEHQQHPASFIREYGMHSCNIAALSSRIIPERTGRRRRREPSSVTVTASLLYTDLHIPSETAIRSGRMSYFLLRWKFSSSQKFSLQAWNVGGWFYFIYIYILYAYVYVIICRNVCFICLDAVFQFWCWWK